MVFKRYIHRHGKKLGPYYYENIRGHDGNVKTIYIGTNPRQHPRHRVRKPLFFLILILVLILLCGSVLFFMQNKAYLIKSAKSSEPNFDVDQILLKVLVKSSESLEKQIRVMNIGSDETSIKAEALGLNDIVKINSPSFSIKPGQTKIVSLNFSSIDTENNIEQQPGIYIGKLSVRSEKAQREIPVVIEIETKNVLFDLNLNPVAFDRKIEQGSQTTIEVRLFNLESIASTNVDVDYFVKDTNGNTIITESETVVVRTQASFFKTISVPKNLKPGSYIFGAEAKFGNSVGTASYLFEVVGPEQTGFTQFCRNNIVCLGLSITTILLLFALMAYFYFFVGAYLYEKFTGTAALKESNVTQEISKEEEQEPKFGILEKIKSRLDERNKRLEEQKLIDIRLKKDEELNRLEQQRKELRLEKQRELEMIATEKEIAAAKRKEQMITKQKELELKLRNEDEEKKIQIEKESRRQQAKEKWRGLFHKIGIYKTQEEKAHLAIEKEKKKQESIRLNEEKKKQEGREKLRAEKQKLAEEKRKEEEDARALALKKNKAKRENPNKNLQKEPSRASSSIFTNLFSRIKQGIYNKKIHETTKKSVKSETEELEDAIKNLNLFQKTEKGAQNLGSEKMGGIFSILKNFRKKDNKTKDFGINNDLERFHKLFTDAKQHMGKSDSNKAKKLYMEARKFYVNLSNEEKKKVYSEFAEFYRKISK